MKNTIKLKLKQTTNDKWFLCRLYMHVGNWNACPLALSMWLSVLSWGSSEWRQWLVNCISQNRSCTTAEYSDCIARWLCCTHAGILQVWLSQVVNIRLSLWRHHYSQTGTTQAAGRRVIDVIDRCDDVTEWWRPRDRWAGRRRWGRELFSVVCDDRGPGYCDGRPTAGRRWPRGAGRPGGRLADHSARTNAVVVGEIPRRRTHHVVIIVSPATPVDRGRTDQSRCKSDCRGRPA